jgi:hypothetical protein
MKKAYLIVCMLILSSMLIVPAASENIPVETSDLKINSITGGFNLKITFKNTAEVDISDVKWNVRLLGDRAIPGEKQGIIDSIAAGAEETIKIWTFGFGHSVINISTEYGEGMINEMNASASLFLFFVKGKLDDRTFLILSSDFEGKTPGYWKNHYEEPRNAWNATGYLSTDKVGDVFSSAWRYDLDNDTLLEALKYKGGNGTQASARMLLRAAVAAILNAAHPLVDYPFPVEKIQFRTNNAIIAGDREGMLTWKDTFDSYNNLGCEDKLY